MEVETVAAVTNQSMTPDKKNETKNRAGFAQTYQKGPPQVSPSKIPTVTVASNAFSVGQHSKAADPNQYDTLDIHNKKRIRFGTSERKNMTLNPDEGIHRSGGFGKSKNMHGATTAREADSPDSPRGMITVSKLDHMRDDEFEVDNVPQNGPTIALPSYADLNSVEQFNFPNGSFDQGRLQVANNLKVRFKYR